MMKFSFRYIYNAKNRLLLVKNIPVNFAFSVSQNSFVTRSSRSMHCDGIGMNVKASEKAFDESNENVEVCFLIDTILYGKSILRRVQKQSTSFSLKVHEQIYPSRSA